MTAIEQLSEMLRQIDAGDVAATIAQRAYILGVLDGLRGEIGDPLSASLT